jgi:hypothetical protein
LLAENIVVLHFDIVLADSVLSKDLKTGLHLQGKEKVDQAVLFLLAEPKCYATMLKNMLDIYWYPEY